MTGWRNKRGSYRTSLLPHSAKEGLREEAWRRSWGDKTKKRQNALGLHNFSVSCCHGEEHRSILYSVLRIQVASLGPSKRGEATLATNL